MEASPPPPDHTDPTGTICPKCAKAKAEAAQKVTLSKQVTAQIGPLILGYALQDDGTHHAIIGASFPGLGVGAYQCYTTGEGGIDGWGIGASAGTPGIGPAASFSTDGKNPTSCVGVAAGDVNGASYAVTVPVPLGPSGNPGDSYVPASMNPDGTIAPARVEPGPAPPPAVAPPAAEPIPANATFSGGKPGDTYVPAAMNPDGTIRPAYSIPGGK
jgi:hypothetical protein